MTRRVGHLIDTAERMLFAHVSADGIAGEAQQVRQVNLAFALAEKFIAEAERREHEAAAAANSPRPPPRYL